MLGQGVSEIHFSPLILMFIASFPVHKNITEESLGIFVFSSDVSSMLPQSEGGNGSFFFDEFN